MRHPLFRTLLPAALAALAASPLPAQTTPLSIPSANSATTLRPVEISYVTTATDVGRVVAEVSHLAVSQATSSAVREFAQQVVQDYGQINGSLETLARRKAVAIPVQPTSFSPLYRGLAANAGAPFDRAYVREIAALCQRELQLCEVAVAEAKDPDLRAMAGTYLPVFRDHVNKSTELLKAL